ncbi:uncharacterized protein LOC121736738 [Aricia agestis]|uniref:uncharacterized protein LOC121736738 n=1 Tax=Aricia agestis TaxID=91739 RepID=UPI001C20B0B6|nr:uncharacterized protein LOC121736738 [Aricia agestis]
MVMQTSKDVAQTDASYDQEDVSMEANLLHEQLAAYALNVAGDEQSNRKGVWGEHSYARARGVGPRERMRSLLAAAPRSPPPADVDVVSVSPERSLPGDSPATPDLDDDDEEEDWERRLRALAPSAAYLRLADDALDTLRQLRLERLALPADAGAWARRESARAAARRLRRALAPHWAGPGGGGAGWLHAALTAQLPRGPRALYREMLQELRRAVPRLAARLPLARPLDRVHDPLAALPEPVGPDADGPWLAWAPSGDEAADRRWTARLGALLHVRRLDADAAPASPERWAAAVGAAARTSLERLRAEAGGRAVAVGGCGAGAALAMWLGGERLLLLSPPLLTAEGAREPESGGCAALLVVGGRAAGCWRGAAAEVGRRARVLLLHGADDALRLPRRLRRYHRLPQHALDAAIAHACARWLVEERAEPRPETPPPPPPMEKGISEDEASPVSSPSRALEVVEGRVMRVSGGTALTLRPRLAPADIMQLPIVFADDAPRRPRRLPPRPRLVLAKRGRRPQ